MTTETKAPTGNVRVRFPGNWVPLETGALRRWRAQGNEVRPELATALELLERAATVFETERVLVAAFLLERGSTEAIATFACFHVGMPALPAVVDFAEHVRSNPPSDALDLTYQVDEDEKAGGRLRARSLRKTVLEIPSRDSVSLAVEYFIPVPDGDGYVVASFSTPNVAKEDEYLALFSSIAASLEFL